MMSREQIILEAVMATTGMSAQSKMARLYAKHFRMGGPRIHQDQVRKKQDNPDGRQEQQDQTRR